ncbi:hypothetical protein [Deinococcus rubellus]|uniref:Uncharacterized protein n=1 Tax=Deinococcus rubellus TaxID=1889240 RepID=A0ABY5YIV9_9DEIO|nr:hypothetical protein [Deinococcus rubellus]UWX64282.1 hypothetical protein N0D28_00985 [Deinococcus rubellus]
MTRITNALNKALSTAEALLEDADKLIKLKAIHALSQTSAALLKVLEVGEMEARVADLEAAELERSDAEQESE